MSMMASPMRIVLSPGTPGQVVSEIKKRAKVRPSGTPLAYVDVCLASSGKSAFCCVNLLIGFWTERIHNYLTSTDGLSAIPNCMCRQVRHHDLVMGHWPPSARHRPQHPLTKTCGPNLAIPRISIHIFLSRRVKVNQSKVGLS